MNFGQLDHYIGDLRQTALTPCVARPALAEDCLSAGRRRHGVLAIPFALSMGRRGSLTGIAVPSAWRSLTL